MLGWWIEKYCQYTSHFTVSYKQLKPIEILRVRRLNKYELLRAYIERFNEEAISVKDVEDKMKMYLLEQGLNQGNDM